ncbi:hypothetical protein [Acidisphaera sp. S103]|uniref:hypothetical protein n=1 Tax=Acidisphaera sp. S103 TaxID=1747223 RepID=UPI00131D6FF2|nr:hypothetical protein [Acidisphaera sp. S103]
MRRQDFRNETDDDHLPVMVPRSDKVLIQTPPERVRRLRRHLIVTLRAIRRMKETGRSTSPASPEPEGFAARVAGTACGLCKGWCCKNGEDDAFLDEPTLLRVRRANPALNARAVLRLFVDLVPADAYQGSCIFHGKQGCTLNRSLRSDVCNSYFCGGLQNYLAGGDVATPAVVIAGEGDKMRRSPILTP